MKPNDIRLHQRSGILELGYPDGSKLEMTAEYLRVNSPSAEVKGHSPDQAVLQHGKKDVRIRGLEPQGNYAIKIVFSDGHDSGIFTWQYLYELGTQHETRWAGYLDALEAEGKTREPKFIAVSK